MIAKIEKINNNKTIVIDGVCYPPIAYRSFRPMPSNIRQFSKSGVCLYQMLVSGRKNGHGVPYSFYGGVWLDKDQYDFKPFDNQIEMFKKFAPGCKIMVMLQLDAPLQWLKSHPESYDGYYRIGEAAIDESYILAAEKYIKAFLEYAQKKYDDTIFGYSFSAGYCTEWFDTLKYYTPSKKKADLFEKWSNGKTVPTKEEMYDISGSCMRSPSSNTAMYRNFCCTLVPKVIKRFAKIIKDTTNYSKIVGLFFGYSDGPDEGWQIASSTNGYEEVWADSNIDMLFAPATYSCNDNCRELEGASTYQYLVDSVALHDKPYLHEIDHRTFLADYPLENGMILESYKDLKTTIEILRRELSCTLAKGGALWWFDFYGNYYACPELEEEIVKQIDIYKKVCQKRRESVSQVAVFADPMSFNLLKEKLNLTVDYVRKNKNNLHKCGAPFDCFNLSDICNIDLSKYKLFVFLYAPKISDDVRCAIEKIKGHKVFIHLPDVASKDGLDYSAAGKICNMKLEAEQKGTKAVYNGQKFGFHVDVEPIFKIADKDAKTLAKYENGDICAAQKENTIYCAVGDIPTSFWRKILKTADVDIYTEKDVALYADSRMIACQFPENTTDILNVKSHGKKYTELFTGKEHVSENGIIQFEHTDYQMMLFLKDED